MSIISLLADPNCSSPANVDAGVSEEFESWHLSDTLYQCDYLGRLNTERIRNNSPPLWKVNCMKAFFIRVRQYLMPAPNCSSSRGEQERYTRWLCYASDWSRFHVDCTSSYRRRWEFVSQDNEGVFGSIGLLTHSLLLSVGRSLWLPQLVWFRRRFWIRWRRFYEWK